MKSNVQIWWAGLFIGLGILLGALSLRNGIVKTQDAQRVVSVKGLSEIQVPADKVTWPIVFKEVNNDLVTLYNNLEKKNKRVIAFLQAQGISAEEITVSPPDIIDYETERYMSPEKRDRFNGTSIITVSSTKVDAVREVIPQIAELIREGIAISANRPYDNPIRYEFTGLNDVKPAMIAEATQNARSSAEKFAVDSQSKLGKIKTASQGQMAIYDRDENSPHIKTLRVVTTVVYYLKD